jgi:hypothetical protein
MWVVLLLGRQFARLVAEQSILSELHSKVQVDQVRAYTGCSEYFSGRFNLSYVTGTVGVSPPWESAWHEAALIYTDYVVYISAIDVGQT